MSWLTPLLLVSALSLFAAAHLALQKRYPRNPKSLIDRIDEILPQTQCAQCGFPGCRPYAEAIVDGAALNLCPPGGNDVYLRLVNLMGGSAETPPTPNKPAVAVIDESQCIGCTLCLPPCPVDAIVGAGNLMHTVIAAECTGCELCIPACPVDCISLQPVSADLIPTFASHITNKRRRPPRPKTPAATPAATPRGCINCSRCNPVCPVDLPAQELLQLVSHQQLDDAAHIGLNECIECGLCDRACPSDIPMAELFASAKHSLADAAAEQAAKQHYKQRFEAHQIRAQQALTAAADKRAERLKKAGRWS